MAACICVYLSVKAANQSLLPTPSQAQFVFVQCSPVIYTTTMLNIAKLECLGERKKIIWRNREFEQGSNRSR